MDYKICVMVCVRDRPTELSLLLQSLRSQTYKNFIVYVLDDCSGTLLSNYHFLACVVNKMNMEGNFIRFFRNDFNLGVSKSRQKLVDLALKTDCDLLMRVDDDVILEPDYIEKLLKVIESGYDLASGVTPFMGQAQFKRESRFAQPIINRVILDKEGTFIHNGDDCGLEYHDESIIPMHHFRSCALYKREIHESGITYDSRLTKHGFREEEILSFKIITEGFKMACNTKAVAWHLMTPSGGERFADSQELVHINEMVLKDFTKQIYIEKGDFIEEYNRKLNINPPSLTEELFKQTNLIMPI